MCYGFTVTIEPAPLIKYVHSLLTTDRGLYVFLSAFFSFDKKWMVCQCSHERKDTALTASSFASMLQRFHATLSAMPDRLFCAHSPSPIRRLEGQKGKFDRAGWSLKGRARRCSGPQVLDLSFDGTNSLNRYRRGSTAKPLCIESWCW